MDRAAGREEKRSNEMAPLYRAREETQKTSDIPGQNDQTTKLESEQQVQMTTGVRRPNDQTTKLPNRNAPEGECAVCKLRMWWQRQDGGWVCGVCHPDPQVLLAKWRVMSDG
jgi:hypothetical protein